MNSCTLQAENPETVAAVLATIKERDGGGYGMSIDERGDRENHEIHETHEKGRDTTRVAGEEFPLRRR
jgi:hypothetical protein